jgi:hypothetical protein
MSHLLIFAPYPICPRLNFYEGTIGKSYHVGSCTIVNLDHNDHAGLLFAAMEDA